MKAFAHITFTAFPTSGTAADALATMTAAPPQIKIYIQANDSANAASPTDPSYFDIHPGSEFASGNSVTDK